jgi:hypothetical protein
VPIYKELNVGVRYFIDNSYDSDAISVLSELSAILTQTPVKTALVGLAYRAGKADGGESLPAAVLSAPEQDALPLLKRR